MTSSTTTRVITLSVTGEDPSASATVANAFVRDVSLVTHTCFVVVESFWPRPGQQFTQAQKMLGRACGLPGVVPGMLCKPEITNRML